MQYKSVKGFSGLSQFGIFVGCVGGGMVLAAISQFLLSKSMIPAGTSTEMMARALENATKDPANAGQLRWMQIIGVFFMMFVPCFLYMWFCHAGKWFWLGFNKYVNIQQVLIAFFVMIVANFLGNPLKELSEMAFRHFPALNAKAIAAEAYYNDQVAVMSTLRGNADYIISLFILVLLPAIFEEMFFHGVLQNLFNRWWKKAIWSVVVTSVLFSLIHMSYILFLTRLLLGIVLSWMFFRSKNIWINIISHFLNNGLALTALFFSAKKTGIASTDKFDPKMPIWSAAIWLLALIVLLWLFEKVSKKNRTIIALKEASLLQQAQPFHDYPEHKNLV